MRTKTSTLVLGDSLAGFMAHLGMRPTGGANGSITRLKKQMERLFLATLTIRWEGDASRQAGGRLNVASSYDLWWSEDRSGTPLLMPSVVTLSPEFFDEVIGHPVPSAAARTGPPASSRPSWSSSPLVNAKWKELNGAACCSSGRCPGCSRWSGGR